MSQEIDFKIRHSIFLPFPKRLRIDSRTISYGGVELRCHDVKEIRYGIVQLYINGIKANRTYSVFLKDKNDGLIRIEFVSVRPFVINKKVENLYFSIVDSLWDNVTKRLTEEALYNLENGRSYKIPNVEVTPKGVRFTMVRWFKKNEEHFVAWKDLRKYSEDGNLHLYSETNPKIKIKINLQTVWNSPVLASVLDFLWQDGRAYALAEANDRF
ncbi:hypothetical protein EFP84_00140 [Leptospira kmetyi]|uniref:Uncharacterized protein n=1 Tax=Leptospira kmetyi TaxID=408139 RepID=A0AAD0UQ46_9LEPT|nr:hypothetical protein [Leptospira kmetyi]AYV54072.1 hypothetical protein EFP84_00140 [Leptospira kmetyi]TGL68388.1 hypothetical protein EHQ67_14530 [Leptospira kmetyi]